MSVRQKFHFIIFARELDLLPQLDQLHGKKDVYPFGTTIAEVSNNIEYHTRHTHICGNAVYSPKEHLAHAYTLRYAWRKALAQPYPICLLDSVYTLREGFFAHLVLSYNRCIKITDDFVLYIRPDKHKGVWLGGGLCSTPRAYANFVCGPKTALRITEILTFRYRKWSSNMSMKNYLRGLLERDGTQFFTVNQDLVKITKRGRKYQALTRWSTIYNNEKSDNNTKTTFTRPKYPQRRKLRGRFKPKTD